MLSKRQLELLYEYTKYCRFEAQRKAREAQAQTDPDAEELNQEIIAEQTRRSNELSDLETALEAEMSILSEECELDA